MSTEERIDVGPLADTYDIVAELGATDSTRRYIGKRRADGMDVLVTVARTPAGDERNALTHLAADVNLLAGLRHRHLVPVLEGRWLGTAAFAVISQRIFAPTVEELLARGERFSNARVAHILREVNGILDWARRERVVHRAVTTDTIHLEPGSDRVLVAFAIRPIPLTGAPEAEGDARTVATLARAMLARSAEAADDHDEPEEQLAQVRPDLPTRIVERTEALLHPTRGGAAPDVPGYLAMIAMADAVKVGEDESTRLTTEAQKEKELTRAQLEAERQEQERVLAEQRAQLAAERAELEREMAEQREALASEKRDLEQAVASDREKLARQRAEMTAAITAAHEQLALERQQLERQRLAAFTSANERAVDRTAAERAPFEVEPSLPEAATETTALPAIPSAELPAADVPPVVELPYAEALAGEEEATPREEEELVGAGAGDHRRDHAAWAVPAGGLTLLGIIVAAVLALTVGRGGPKVARAAADSSAAAGSTATPVVAARDSAKLVVDSSAGTVTAAATPAAAADSAKADSARADSVRADSVRVAAAARRAAAAKRARARAAAQAARDSAGMDSTNAASPFSLPSAPRPTRTPRADSMSRDTTAHHGNTALRDSVTHAKPDTTPPAGGGAGDYHR